VVDGARSQLLVAFGASVRDLRRARLLSQETFAERVGIHRTYVGDVERGERNIGLVNIGRLAAALEITLAELMAEVDRRRDVGAS